MPYPRYIVYLFLLLMPALLSYGSSGIPQRESYIFFYGDTIHITTDSSVYVNYSKPIAESSIKAFYEALKHSSINGVTDSLLAYKATHQPDDWIYYHLIRAAAEKLSPKAANYERYTLYKWFILVSSGYASMLSITPGKMLLYIQSDEDVLEIPVRKHNGKQFVCLNYHDYGEIDFEKDIFKEADVGFEPSGRSFSYRITKLPDFSSDRYVTKELEFDYYQRDYDFKILVNPDIQKIFANYPVLNYAYYFSMPMSRVTYSSLIPLLKKYLYKLNQKKGVDYLMHFVRYTFSFETDTRQFGKEKRLSPEQTLLYERSDCEDRAAFFFYLVKEIYDLPMIVLCYPNHVTVAVNFGGKVAGKPIKYKGSSYYVCEPTSQKEDLKIGELLPELRHVPYQVVYEYKTNH